MDCKEFRESLDLYVDGELSPEATFSARAHLEACVACGRVEQQLLALRRAVKRVVTEREPPPGLLHNVRSLARPDRHGLPSRPLTESQSLTEGAESAIPVWRKKVAVPVPAFALLLLAIPALGGWAITTRPVKPSTLRPTGVRKAVPEPSASAPMKGFDLSLFDRGGRAAIYKVRLTGHEGREP